MYLTFDDGGAGACRAAGLLERRGWRGHFFLATNWIGKPGFLTADQVRGLRRKGHAVGSHSCSHPLRMRELAWKSLVREWSESVEIISGILGERVRMASVPSGSYTVKVGRAAARAGIRVLFTSEPTAAAGMVDGCLVLGRYVVTRRTSPGEAAALARGDFWPCYRQALCWKAKKAAKITAGGLYERLRAAAFRWGAAG